MLLCFGARLAAAEPTADADPGRYWASGDWHGERLQLINHGVNLNAVDITDAFSDVTGGIRPGESAQSFVKLSADFDLDKALGWQSASAHISGAAFIGHGVSSSRVGNLLTVTDIDARPQAGLYEAWLEQSLFAGRLSLRIGLEQPTNDFMRHRFDGLFANSSFTTPALASDDILSQKTAMPLLNPGLRFRAHVQISRDVDLMAAVYGGKAQPKMPGSHVLTMAEIRYAPNRGLVGELPGSLKLGAWQQGGSYPDFQFDDQGRPLASPASSGRPLLKRGDYGVYAVADQMISRHVGVFARVVAAPGDRNYLGVYADGGVVWEGPLPGRPNDRLGLAAGYGRIGDAIRNLDRYVRAVYGPTHPVRSSEAVVEATYQIAVRPWWTVQPDVQYVVRPGVGVGNPLGPSRGIPNAVVLGVRTEVII
jgi:porin